MNTSQDGRGLQLISVIASFLVLTWVTVGLRCVVRTRIINVFGAEDWLMALSLVIFTFYSSFILVAVYYGLGEHNKSLPQDREIQALKYQALAIATYIFDMALIKLSIALFLLRLSVKRHFKWTLKISLAIVCVWTASIFLFNLFRCRPIEFQWDYTIAGGTCVPKFSLINASYTFSALSILSDWFYSLLPIPMLWSVRIHLPMKIALVAVFGLGILPSIATIIRIRYLIDLIGTDDILYTITDAMIWTVIESGLGITAASIVTLRPLIRNMRTVSLNNGGFASTSNNLSTRSREIQSNMVPVIVNNTVQLAILPASHGDMRARSSVVVERIEGSARAYRNRKHDSRAATDGHGTESGSQDFILMPPSSINRATHVPGESESNFDVEVDIDLEANQVVNT